MVSPLARRANKTPLYEFRNAPQTPVVRIGRRGANLWVPTPWTSTRLRTDGTFGYRFDDPRRRHNPVFPLVQMYRMIYCATDVMGAVCEVGAGQLPSLDVLASATGQPTNGVIDEFWCSTRDAGFTMLGQNLVFVDIASRTTCNMLRGVPEVASLVSSLGYTDLDPSMLKGPDRVLTQGLALHIFEISDPHNPVLPGQRQGTTVAGIRYLSRHGDGTREFECWALYDTRLVHTALPNQPLTLDARSPLYSGLTDAAAYLGLSVV